MLIGPHRGGLGSQSSELTLVLQKLKAHGKGSESWAVRVEKQEPQQQLLCSWVPQENKQSLDTIKGSGGRGGVSLTPFVTGKVPLALKSKCSHKRIKPDVNKSSILYFYFLFFLVEIFSSEGYRRLLNLF